ncbi:MAG: acylphosphatase [Thiohalomonadaceae bacterium]
MSCCRCLVAGKVQGVWYRAATQRQALALGLTGYARNLPDGRVEVLVCGDETALQQLRDWLWQGPPAAAVSDVRCESVADAARDGFATF